MVTAFILVMTKAGKEKEVLRQILKIDGVVEVWVVYGDYDIIAKVSAEDMTSLDTGIVSKIRALANVSVTTTLISM